MGKIETLEQELLTLRAQLAQCQAHERQRDRVFASMVRAFVLGEIITDARGRAVDYRILEVNAAFTRLTGIPAQTAMGGTARGLFPDIDPAWIEAFAGLKEGGETLQFEAYSKVLGKWLEVTAFHVARDRFAYFLLDISARKATEFALRENEQRLRLATEAADIGVFDWDVTHDRTTWQNARMYAIFARDPAQGAISKAELLRDYVLPEDVGALDAALAEGIRTGGRIDHVYRIRHPDGGVRSLELLARFIGRREAPRMVAVIADVTERRRAEELRRREHEFRTLVENSSDLIARIDRRLRHVYVNPAVEAVTGRCREEYIGKTNEELGMPPEQVAAWNAHAEEVFRTGHSKTAEFSLTGANGRTITYEWLIVPEFGADGTIETVLTSARDVTARKEAERIIAEGNRMLQTVLDNIPAMITWYELNGQLRFVNKALELTTGWSADELRTGGFLAKLIPDIDDRVRAWTHMLHPEGGWRDFRLAKPDGTRFDSTWSNVSLSDGSHIGIGIDITDRKRAERDVRLVAAVFSSTNEAIFVTDLDHRIVTVNPAFTRITGFGLDDVRGKSPKLQHSGRHTDDFYRGIWRTLARDGQWQGEIWNRRKDGEVYPAWENISAVKDEQGRVTNYVAVLSDISSIKLAEARMAYLAHHDALTGLPNRLAFAANLEQSLERAKRHQEKVGLLFLDLDRFKLINDTLGHAAGDRLLQVVGERLKASVRAEDLVTRLGGDEFTIVLEELREPEEAAQLAEKIILSLAEPIPIDGREVVTSTSIGISVFPDNAERAQDLAKAADAAMYRAKEHGRGRYEFYSPELTLRATEHFMIEGELRHALARDELVLHYQPRIDLATGELRGAEALLRWRHPQRGLLHPEHFLVVAEESGLIEPIGEWVMHEALSQVGAWRRAGLRPIPIAVNMCGREILRDHRVVDALEAARKECGLGCEHMQIEIEVTESIMQSGERSTKVLRALRDHGVGIGIDDFGTGYSSLSRLMDLPIDTLKIDRGFVRGIPTETNSKAVTAAIISMGHTLGMRVIAEGVETPDQLAFLAAHGCDEAQGFLISRAVPAEDVTAMLRMPRLVDIHLSAAMPRGREGV